MKKVFFLSLLLTALAIQNTYATDVSGIIHILSKMYGLNVDIKNLDQNLFDVNKDQLTQLNAINQDLTGTHRYGSMNYNSHQYSWGDGSDNWQSLLSLYKTGGGGELATMAGKLSKDFPIADNLDTTNPTENEYYRLQAQTTLASRASSQLAFNQVSQESKVVETLHDEIDQTKDNKSSVDLNNRMLSEQNRMSIQQTKLLATLVQQAAIDSQEKANHAKENATFFDYKK